MARPHGMLSVSGSAITASFTQDPNGNLTGATGIGRTVAYNAANKTATITQWNEYLMVGGSMVGVRFLQSTSVTLLYLHQDHLGSIAVPTDQTDANDPTDSGQTTRASLSCARS